MSALVVFASLLLVSSDRTKLVRRGGSESIFQRALRDQRDPRVLDWSLERPGYGSSIREPARVLVRGFSQQHIHARRAMVLMRISDTLRAWDLWLRVLWVGRLPIKRRLTK